MSQLAAPNKQTGPVLIFIKCSSHFEHYSAKVNDPDGYITDDLDDDDQGLFSVLSGGEQLQNEATLATSTVASMFTSQTGRQNTPRVRTIISHQHNSLKFFQKTVQISKFSKIDFNYQILNILGF